MMKSLRIAFAASLLCLASYHAMAKPAPLKPVDVFVSHARIVNVPKVLLAVGHMQAIRSVNLSFDESGRLMTISERDGATVKKGQVIATLNSQADAALLTSLASDYTVAKSKYERLLKIQKYGGISPQVLEQAKADMISAQSKMKEQQVIVNRKTLRAPFAGALGNFKYSIGAYLTSGQALVALVQQAPLRVRYSVPAANRAQIEIGQAVDVTTEAYKNKVFHGIVSYISPKVDTNSGTVTLEARFDNKDYLLSPGMFVSARQVLKQKRALLMIPDIALMTDINGQYVYKVEGSHVKKVYVQVGVVQKGLAQITKGLQKGDTVVTAGQQRLDDGDAINVLSSKLAVHPKTKGHS